MAEPDVARSERTQRKKRAVAAGRNSTTAVSSTRSKRASKAAERQSRALKEDLLLAQTKALETLCSDASMQEMLDVFANEIERQSKNMLCSVLLLEGDIVRHGAAPNLPREFVEAVDGSRIGPKAGSCGTAAYFKRQVIVADIANDPLWEDYKQLALPHGLRACWSTPILGASGEVLGTFALYYKKPRVPTERELQRIAIWTKLASLGIRRKQAQESLEAEQRLLQDLYRTQEYERKLIAYELHDGIAQYAVAAKMHLECYQQPQGKRASIADLQTVKELLQTTIDESRRMINGLRPTELDAKGVVAAIEQLIASPAMAGAEILFEHPAKFPRLASVLETALYRIAQEALNNARQHSGSERIEVTLKRTRQRVQLSVRDWGRGFAIGQVSSASYGLAGIRERCRLLRGSVVIASEPDQGTTIAVDLPYRAPVATS